jgi:membrane-bound inhibitor of C-type lysozyme
MGKHTSRTVSASGMKYRSVLAVIWTYFLKKEKKKNLNRRKTRKKI